MFHCWSAHGDDFRSRGLMYSWSILPATRTASRAPYINIAHGSIQHCVPLAIASRNHDVSCLTCLSSAGTRSRAIALLRMTAYMKGTPASLARTCWAMNLLLDLYFAGFADVRVPLTQGRSSTPQVSAPAPRPGALDRACGRCGIPQIPIIIRALGTIGNRHSGANRPDSSSFF